MPRYLAKGLRGAITTSEAKIQMHRGYVKVWRKLEDSGILKDERACQFFLWAMLKATHRPHKQIVGNQVVELEPGQFISGRKSASEEMNISEMVFRGMMKKMESTEFVTIKSTNKFSIFTINNWATYQSQEPTNNQQINQQVTNSEPTDNQQVTTNKNIKNSKNDKKEEYCTHKKRKLTGKRLETFNEFWRAFDYPRGKAEAADAWLDIPELTDGLVNKIVEAAKIEAAGRAELVRQGRTPKMAQGWISGKRWEDGKYSPVRSTGYTPEELYAMRTIN